MDGLEQLTTGLGTEGISNSAVVDVLYNDFKATGLKDGNIVGADDVIIAKLSDLREAGIIDDVITKEQFTNAFNEFREGTEAGGEEGGSERAEGAEGNKDAIVLKEGDELEVNGIMVTIDAEGNAIDKDNKVIATPEQLKELVDEAEAGAGAEGDDDEVDYIADISKLDGYVVNDEEGNPLTFENTLEGLAKRNAFIVKEQSQQAVNNTFEKFFTENPDLEDMWNYKNSNNGSLEGYNRDVSLLTLEIKDDTDEKSLMRIVKDAEIRRGRTAEAADSLVEYFKAEDKLGAEAKVAQAYLKDIKAKEDTFLSEQQDRVHAQQVKDQEKHWSSVKTIIDSGNLAGLGIKIPESLQVKGTDGVIRNITREDLYNYSSKSVNANGNSQAQLDRANSEHNLEYKVLIDLLQLTGGDLSQLIKEQVSEADVLKLSNRKKNLNTKGVRKFTLGKRKSGVDNIKV